MNAPLRIRNVAMVLVGVVVLLSKGWIRESFGSLAYAYLGNLSASFAAFFVVAIAATPEVHRIWIAVVALAIVEGFEWTNGFGVMTNVYDPLDYLANGLGIALAFGVDLVLVPLTQVSSTRDWPERILPNPGCTSAGELALYSPQP
jgi:hypothetical protein